MFQANMESFKQKWWKSNPEFLTPKMLHWMSQTNENPEDFFLKLQQLYKELFPNAKTSHNETYDFYSDCIFGKIALNLTAFTEYESEGARNYTHHQIHACINAHIKQFHDLAIPSGKTVVITLKPSIEWIIALFLCFRLGLRICYLPIDEKMLPKKKVEEFITQLDPDFLISDQNELQTIENLQLLPIDPSATHEQNFNPTTHTYKPDDIVFVVLNMTDQTPFDFTEISASQAFEFALRDGMISLGLESGSKIALPLSDPLLYEPCTTLIVFLMGSNLVHIPDKILRLKPNLLQDTSIHMLGISNELQNLWAEKPLCPKIIKGVFKSPFFQNEPSWSQFAEMNTLEKTLVSNILIDASKGGVILFSKPTLKIPPYYLKSGLGIQWELAPLQKKEASPTTLGIYQIQTMENRGNYLLLHFENFLLLSDTWQPTVRPYIYPTESIEKCINTLPFVVNSMIYPIKEVGQIGAYRFILLVFLNPLMKEKLSIGELNEILFSEISHSFGKIFLPDQIFFYPLSPRMKNENIDREWVKDQFRTGHLDKKKELAVFQTIGQIKQLLI